MIALMLLSAAGASRAHAYPAMQPSETGAIITVDTFGDWVQEDGNCSLREAILAANTNASADTCPAGSGIEIDRIVLPAGFYPISRAGEDDTAQYGDLDILDDVVILGSGREYTIVDGGDIDRVFHIAAAVEVVIQHLTIQNGRILDEDSGGGGVLNWGTLTLRDVTLQGNHAFLVGGGLLNWSHLPSTAMSYVPSPTSPLSSARSWSQEPSSLRDAFLKDNFTARLASSSVYTATATVVNSFLTDNEAGDGGAIFNTLDSQVYLNNSTLSANSAITETGGALDNAGVGSVWNVTISGNDALLGGGGIFNDGTLEIESSTIVNNASGDPGAAGNVQALNLTRFSNSLVANHASGSNCIGDADDLVSSGYNLDSGSSCRFIHPEDVTGTGELTLGSLADNGGLTPTHALLLGSPAIDVGDDGNCPTWDQRGAVRPADGTGDDIAHCDIGAYEFDAEFPELLFVPLIHR